MTTSPLELSTLYNDKQASSSIFTDTEYKPHSNNMGIHVCQIREIIEDGKDVVMDYWHIKMMVTDGPTKPLAGVKHVVFVNIYGFS